MSFPARTPWPARIRARSYALLAVTYAYGIGVWRVIAMFVRNPDLLPLALRAPLALHRQLRKAAPSVPWPPLLRVSDGIWRVPPAELCSRADPRASTRRADDDESEQCVVLHYTGTGESVHAAHENTYHLFAREPRLAQATHYVFEAPLQKGAYYGAELFSGSVWERVQTIVSHYEGPFVLVGVSRGGMVALDHGMRIVEECGKVASVLALSAPLGMPQRIPAAIRTIADFVDVLVRFADVWPQLFMVVQSRLSWIIRQIYVMLTALILRHHGVYDVHALARNARDLFDHGVLQGSLRAAREFRLLLRVSERELSLYRQMMARALLRHHDRFFVSLVWGKNDVWIDAERCRAHVLEAIHKDMPELALSTAVLPDQGHLLSARDHDRHEFYQASLARVVDAALSANQNLAPERDPTLSLRGASPAPAEGHDD